MRGMDLFQKFDCSCFEYYHWPMAAPRPRMGWIELGAQSSQTDSGTPSNVMVGRAKIGHEYIVATGEFKTTCLLHALDIPKGDVFSCD